MERSPLVRLNITDKSREQIRVLCMSQNISDKGISLLTPCRFDLTPGAMLDMELFLPKGPKPVHVSGQIRRITMITCEDSFQYTLDFAFHRISKLASKEIVQYLGKRGN